MQRSLLLLVLMGHWSFFSCHLYEYHFINKEKTWDEAREYCRKRHTDLATMYDMTDVQRLRDLIRNRGEAWIGLRSEPGKENREWHWSLPGVEFTDSEKNWGNNEPNDASNGDIENCVRMVNNKWQDLGCGAKHIFICYKETNPPNKRFHLINISMTWTQAQSYCREHHTDLVSGTKQLQDEEFKNESRSVDNVWIGLFRDTWWWSDGEKSSFRNWDQESFASGVYTKRCAAFSGSGKWRSENCMNKKPFFCYDDKVILIKDSKTWEEALYYCRENYNDLVSITDHHQQRWIEERATNASTEHIWLGLRYTCTLGFWFWIDDENVDYDNWASNETTDDCDMSAAMERGGEHKWVKKLDDQRLNFMCSKC